jgi:hypothetical protein
MSHTPGKPLTNDDVAELNQVVLAKMMLREDSSKENGCQMSCPPWLDPGTTEGH